MEQLGLAVLAQQQIAAEAGAEAERIDVEIGQVGEMDRVGQAQVIAVRRRIEVLPEALPSLPASFRGEHGRGLAGARRLSEAGRLDTDDVILDRALVAVRTLLGRNHWIDSNAMRGRPAEGMGQRGNRIHSIPPPLPPLWNELPISRHYL